MSGAARAAGYEPRHRPAGGGQRGKIAVTLAAALVVGLVAGTATWSAWTAQTDNTGNTFQTGTVQLNDNDGGVSALFSLPAMGPGTATSRCIRVDYTGTLPAGVRLYGAGVTGTLGSYLDLTVTRGTAPAGPFGDCAGFTPDAVDHRGLGPGVLYDGLTSAYPSTWAAGIADPAATWVGGDSHFYRFTVEVQSDNAAQGRNLTQTLTWEAR
jgi:predicted ribosomally synthesized peptide with SipW-like signal peptide